MDFVSLGMFILDDIYYPIPRAPVTGIIGGAGSYAVLGARIMQGSGHGIGWTVHVGSDFPEHVRKEIESWETGCQFIDTPGRLTTRGLNTYRQQERRDFQYLSPKIRIDHNILTEEQVEAKVFHLVCSPLRCIDLVMGILGKLCGLHQGIMANAGSLRYPMFVWEPVPEACKPSELPNFLEALRYVNVMSPNLEELESLLGTKITRNAGQPDLEKLEDKCRELLGQWSGPSVDAVVVRMGELGSRVIQRDRSIHVAPYHQPLSAMKTEIERSAWRNKVVDPTGAGNAFLGGFCIGLLKDTAYLSANCYERGALYGSVAASFAVEQVGTPTLTPNPRYGREQWNGVYVQDRLRSYRELSDISHLFSSDLERASVLGWVERIDVDASRLLRALESEQRPTVSGRTSDAS